jgi:hypothetical protein
MENKKTVKTEPEATDVAAQYQAQVGEQDDVHFEHVDWTYNDSSGCCC